MIDIVGYALDVHQIHYVRCIDKNRDFRAHGGLDHFRKLSHVQVLLLPLSLGAEGLDLTNACHIFLLEPLLNVQQEQQAINRIDRLGQTRKTCVHKYVLLDTIEENIRLVQQESSHRNDDDAMSYSNGKQCWRIKTDDAILSATDVCFILGIDFQK
jgi:E3 ubiquitin-protein ligase SHPRH